MKTVDIYLDERKLSVEDVSEGTGIHFERVEAIALGRWTPNPKDRARIAEFLEVGIDDVVSDFDKSVTFFSRAVRFPF